jgi:hypothetical protein
VTLLTDALTAPLYQKPVLGTWSGSAVQGIGRIIAEGGSVCLFPCGAPAYGHTPNPPSKQVVSLIRTLGVPVVFYTLHGGAGAFPRWADERRKGPFIGRYERTLTPAEYACMSDDELYALIVRVTGLYAQFYNWEPRITEAQQLRFLQICLSRAGADSMITPREILRDYMTVLNILMQNEDADFERIIARVGAESTPVTDAQSAESAETGVKKPDFSPEDIIL